MKNILKLIELLNNKSFKVFTFLFSLTFFLGTLFLPIPKEMFLQYGYFGVFIFNIFSSGLLLIPKLVNILNPIAFTLVSAFGMSVNESINWLTGYTSNYVIQESEKEKKYEKIIKKYGMIPIFFLALIPFPFDFVGIIAGRLNISYTKFVITVFIARIIRFGVVIFLINKL